MSEEFRQWFSLELDAVDLSQSSNTRFDGVRNLLASTLELDPQDIYIAGASTRASNLPIRLRQGRAQDRHFSLGIGVLGTDEHRGGVAAILNTMDSGNYDAIALVMREASGWMVTDIAVARPIKAVERLLTIFPDAQTLAVQPGDDEAHQEGEPLDTLATRFPTAGDFQRFTARTDDLDRLLPNFLDYAAAEGVEIDLSNAADFLAAVLSSQLLLFAGPSGTGKSTVARLLSSFFSPPASRTVFEAKRHWVGPEDLVGYYSVMADTYVVTPETLRLVDLANAALRVEGEDNAQFSPCLVVEEANLSPMEGYLGPIVHGLSRLKAVFVPWALHGRADPVIPDGGDPVPGELALGPYPRVLGTINVDATAMAPAKKVVARSAVILLEPTATLTGGSIRDLVQTGLRAGSATSGWPAGVGYLGDPLWALEQSDQRGIDDMATALLPLLSAVGAGRNLVSRRDLFRCLAYMAYYEALVGSGPPARTLAAENAVLHFILPGLSSDQFAVALRALAEQPLVEAADQRALGGLLKSRVERLHAAVTGEAIGSVDFWTALS